MNISLRKSGGRQRGGGGRGKEISESAHHLSASYHHLEWCCPPSSTAGGRGRVGKGSWAWRCREPIAKRFVSSPKLRPSYLMHCASAPEHWITGPFFPFFSKFNLIVLKWRAALCNAQFDSPLFVSVIHAELLCVCACVHVCAPQT